MASLEFVQAYMDDLLIITRGMQDKHLQKMETVLTRLRDVGLKVNAAKSLFCAHEIEYLSYILTREGIKPQLKKVQAILALNSPNNVKELRHFSEWYNTTGTCGRDIVKCRPLSLTWWESAEK
jgi:hypothetical protein